MRRPHCVPSAASISLVALSFISLVALAGGQQAPPKPDGLVRSELSLGGRTATLTYSPDLGASDAANAPVLSAAPAAGARVRVARLDTTGQLRIGTVDVPGPDPTVQPPGPARYELWLASASDGWQLQIVSGSGLVGSVEGSGLPREVLSPPASRFVAALVPEAGAAGRLKLGWGGYEAATPVQFVNPQRRRKRHHQPHARRGYERALARPAARAAQRNSLRARERPARQRLVPADVREGRTAARQHR
jgi:hypothetical protein